MRTAKSTSRQPIGSSRDETALTPRTTEHCGSEPAPAAQASELRFIKLKEVMAICGKSRTSVYESIKTGTFPPPVKLGGRSSAWVKSEVLEWAQTCIDRSRTKSQA